MVIKVFFAVLVLCTAAVVAVVLAIHFRVKRHLREEASTAPGAGGAKPADTATTSGDGFGGAEQLMNATVLPSIETAGPGETEEKSSTQSS